MRQQRRSCLEKPVEYVGWFPWLDHQTSMQFGVADVDLKFKEKLQYIVLREMLSNEVCLSGRFSLV